MSLSTSVRMSIPLPISRAALGAEGARILRPRRPRASAARALPTVRGRVRTCGARGRVRARAGVCAWAWVARGCARAGPTSPWEGRPAPAVTGEARRSGRSMNRWSKRQVMARGPWIRGTSAGRSLCSELWIVAGVHDILAARRACRARRDLRSPRASSGAMSRSTTGSGRSDEHAGARSLDLRSLPRPALAPRRLGAL